MSLLEAEGLALLGACFWGGVFFYVGGMGYLIWIAVFDLIDRRRKGK